MLFPTDSLQTKIIGQPKGNIDQKRFYLPGVTIISDCPKCRRSQTKDLGQHCIYYGGNLNGENKIYFYCEECEEGAEWNVIIFLDVSVKFSGIEYPKLR